MKTKVFVPACIIGICLLSSCALYPAPQGSAGPIIGRMVLNANSEQRTVTPRGISVAEARRLAVANGLTGYKPLPPGIAKNLARGKPLPPGIARTRMPADMMNALPQIEGHEWRISGRDLVLIAIGTLVVVEILENVFE